MNKNTYLMWVGSDNYETIDEWVEEATRLGVSKRLPSVSMAGPLKNSIVFVAHDEGQSKECPECMGELENPEYRKLITKRTSIVEEVDLLEVERDNMVVRGLITVVEGEPTGSHTDVVKYSKINRLIDRRRTALELIDDDLKIVPSCVKGGTGGCVELDSVQDGGACRVDYRKYNYWLHQPEKFDAMWKVKNKDMCECCGGTGKLPIAMVFGLFVPTAVEYVLGDDDDKVVENEMEKRGFKCVTKEMRAKEIERKCGYRHQGVYAVTTTKTTKTTKEVVKMLTEEGLLAPSEIEIKGNYVSFLKPRLVDEKRFRGIKRWTPNVSGVVDEAEMILDAME